MVSAIDRDFMVVPPQELSSPIVPILRSLPITQVPSDSHLSLLWSHLVPNILRFESQEEIDAKTLF